MLFAFVAVIALACTEENEDPRTGETLNVDNENANLLGVTEDDIANADFIENSDEDLDAAIALLQDGQYASGVTAMEKFIDTNPDNIDARWTLGNFFLSNYIKTRGKDARDIEDAVMHLKKVVELDPDWGYMAYYQLAEAHFYWTKYDEAIEYMNEFKNRLDPDDNQNLVLAEERLLLYEKGLQHQQDKPEQTEIN